MIEILDVCCSGRMFWYDKTHPQTIYADIRTLPKGTFANNWNPGFEIAPNVQSDFRALPFANASFSLVVFDPPHLLTGTMEGVLNKKYGKLNKDTWKEDIGQGFRECWRVLKPNGTLIFKWAEANIKIKEVLATFDREPLFGDFTGKSGKTRWMTFLKPSFDDLI